LVNSHPPSLQAATENLELLDDLGIPALALDAEARALRWNREFLELFPEHEGNIHSGEPYTENLRRFYSARLDHQELPNIERYVADGLERHRRQRVPFEFLHRGRWLRAETLLLPCGGRLRFWSPASPPRDADTLAARMVDSGKYIPEASIEHLADGLIIRDAQGQIILANRRFAELYGLESPTEAIGKSVPDVLSITCKSLADAEEARRCWADNSRFPGAPFELPLPRDRWVRVQEHRTHDGSLISTHVDITDLWRLQRSANEAQKRAEELAAMLSAEMEERKRAEAQTVQVARLVSLGQMATGLAHELNQPLTIMSLAAENVMLALRRQGPEAIPQALERLETIVAASMRARGIVDHLRIFGRQEDKHAATEPVNLKEVVQGALILTEAAIRSVGIALSVSLPPREPWVTGKLIPLEQAVVNLLLNARDALTSKHTTGGTITLTIEEQDGQAILTVADNGGGFSPAALRQALEPFFTTKEVGEGTGLGLSLAYSTVRAFGGSITLGNTAVGAVVQIMLPALQVPGKYSSRSIHPA